MKKLMIVYRNGDKESLELSESEVKQYDRLKSSRFLGIFYWFNRKRFQLSGSWGFIVISLDDVRKIGVVEVEEK